MASQVQDGASIFHLTDCRTVTSSERLRALAVSRLVASSLSFIGAVSIVVYILRKHKLKSSETHPLFFLGLSDLLLSTVWVVGNGLFLHGMDEPCNVIAFIVWSLEILTHMLTLMYAVVTWMKVRELSMSTVWSRERRAEFNRKRSIAQKIGYVICWLLPFALGVPRYIHSTEPDCLRCVTLWAEDTPEGDENEGTDKNSMVQYASTVFIVILLLVFSGLVILYGHVRVMIKRIIRGRGVFGSSQRIQEQQIQNRALFYIFVFFVTWLLTLVVTMWTRIQGYRLDVKNDTQFGILMAQAWTMPMQGFLNCIAYGWSKSNFRSPTSKVYTAVPFREEGINDYGSIAASDISSSL